MTAPWREEVAEALHSRLCLGMTTTSAEPCESCYSDADALAPTIERLLTEARAEALREAATSLGHIHQADSAGASACIRWLRDRAARIARTAAQTPAAEEPHPTCAHCGHVRGLHGRNHGCISAFPDGRSGGSCGCPGYVTPATSPEEGR